MSFVLDACLALTWFFEDERDEYAEAVRTSLRNPDATAVVPRLWRAGIANALIVAERRKRIAAEKTDASLAVLERFPIEVRELDASSAELVALARAYMISGYDAAYLQLARSLGLPLASVDGGLETARRAAGIPKYQP